MDTGNVQNSNFLNCQIYKYSTAQNEECIIAFDNGAVTDYIKYTLTTNTGNLLEASTEYKITITTKRQLSSESEGIKYPTIAGTYELRF